MGDVPPPPTGLVGGGRWVPDQDATGWGASGRLEREVGLLATELDGRAARHPVVRDDGRARVRAEVRVAVGAGEQRRAPPNEKSTNVLSTLIAPLPLPALSGVKPRLRPEAPLQSRPQFDGELATLHSPSVKCVAPAGADVTVAVTSWPLVGVLSSSVMVAWAAEAPRASVATVAIVVAAIRRVVRDM